MRLILHSFDLVLKHEFTISRRSFNRQQSLIVELQHQGVFGYGEATCNPYYPNTGIDYMKGQLENIRSEIESLTSSSPDLLWSDFEEALRESPFAHCALDVALWDLYGKIKGQPLYQIWGTKWENVPGSCYTLSIAEPAVLIQRMREHPWPIYKIKLGTSDDIGMVRQIRQQTNARLFVDANAAWTVEDTIDKSHQLKALGVEFIEQPLPSEDWEGMKEVFKKSALPIIADESCRIASDVERCAECFHGINIKIMKCGGLSPALKMIQRAREKGLQVMVGCMTESTVGISAIAQLLPQLDYADMDGPLYLKEDIAKGARITAEAVYPGDGPGTGVELYADLPKEPN